MFISYLDTHLSNLCHDNINSYVFLDSNINLLTINNNNTAALYMETIYSNGFVQKVGKATRIQNNSFSLIDHILCKTNRTNISTCTILTDFSDHFVNVLSIPTCETKTGCKFQYTRNFTKKKINEFKQLLKSICWQPVLTLNDTNTAFDTFWDIFHTFFNLHFPIKKMKFNRNIHKIQAFMTTGLLISRQTKNELHKKAILNPDVFGIQYRMYRNIFNSLVKKKQTIIFR